MMRSKKETSPLAGEVGLRSNPGEGDALGLHYRGLRTYGRRKGHALSARQQRLMTELLPQLAIDVVQPIDPARLFDPQAEELWLEIGFGAGEHLIEQAGANLRAGLISAEPYLNGVASLLGQIETRGLKNIRVHHGDARDVIAALPGASLARVFLLFPDPWPKARHHKRRLISWETAKGLAHVMKKGAELRFASDDAEYAAAAREALVENGLFGEVAAPDGAKTSWPQTRYEAKALRAGRMIQRLIFVRS